VAVHWHTWDKLSANHVAKSDRCRLTEVGNLITSSLSLLVVFDESPGISIRSVSVDLDGCVSALIDVMYMGLLAAGAGQLGAL